VHRIYAQVYRAVRERAVFNKHAAVIAQDDELSRTKAAHALQIITTVKEAGIADIARGAWGHIPPEVRKGLMYGAGAAVPAVAGGSYLAHRAGDEARDTTTHIRNQALLAALGIAGAGAGLMGVHRMLQQAPVTTAAQAPGTASMKVGSACLGTSTAVDLLEKLATVGFLDTVLEDQEKNGNADAATCRYYNAERGLDILCELLA
jgi:hypothetical protein